MKLHKWQVPLTIVLFISGVLMATALKALADNNQSPTQHKNDSLVAMVKSQEGEIARLKADISSRRANLERYQKNLAEGKANLESQQAQLQHLQMLAGLTNVTGRGITVTLDDNDKDYNNAKNKANDQVKPEDFLIHDKQLLYIVNDLKAAGAEAISINGERIIGLSDIRCAGTMITVNGTARLGPPFRIIAIGDPDRMQSYLERQEGEFNILKNSGFPVTITKSNQLSVAAYKGSYQFSYARPKEGN